MRNKTNLLEEKIEIYYQIIKEKNDYLNNFLKILITII